MEAISFVQPLVVVMASWNCEFNMQNKSATSKLTDHGQIRASEDIYYTYYLSNQKFNIIEITIMWAFLDWNPEVR